MSRATAIISDLYEICASVQREARTADEALDAVLERMLAEFPPRPEPPEGERYTVGLGPAFGPALSHVARVLGGPPRTPAERDYASMHAAFAAEHERFERMSRTRPPKRYTLTSEAPIQIWPVANADHLLTPEIVEGLAELDLRPVWVAELPPWVDELPDWLRAGWALLDTSTYDHPERPGWRLAVGGTDD